MKKNLLSGVAAIMMIACIPQQASAKYIPTICEILSGFTLIGTSVPCPITDGSKLAKQELKTAKEAEKLTSLFSQLDVWKKTLSPLTNGIQGLTKLASTVFDAIGDKKSGIPMIKDDNSLKIPGRTNDSSSSSIQSFASEIENLFLKPNSNKNASSQFASQAYTDGLATALAAKKNTESVPEKIQELKNKVDQSDSLREDFQASNSLKIALLQSLVNINAIDRRNLSVNAAHNLKQTTEDNLASKDTWEKGTPYSTVGKSEDPDIKTLDALKAKEYISENIVRLSYLRDIFNYSVDMSQERFSDALKKRDDLEKDYSHITKHYNVRLDSLQEIPFKTEKILFDVRKTLVFIERASRENNLVLEDTVIRDNYQKQYKALQFLMNVHFSEKEFEEYIQISL